ncbi:MAG: PHP domain-containing protein [Candidatus Aminicenantes bacterium]|nr:PHP domain-containing protein [Candidatus Aminicenantes bacterium]
MDHPRPPEVKKRRHPVRTVLFAALAVYIAWLAVQILSYRKYVSPPEPARAEITSFRTDGSPDAAPARAGAPEPVELRGAFHLHTRHSDGTKTVEEVAAAAERAGLDFVILTDHGSPNFASFDSQRQIGRVMVIAGAEISSSRGHLVALGFKRPTQRFSQNAESAAREVAALGGFTVIAHPYSKTRWSWGDRADFSGLEIISFDSDLRRGWAPSLLYAPVLLIKPSLALLKILDPPTTAVHKWDRLLEEDEGRAVGPYLGYFSIDAHRLFYETALGVLNLHVQLDSLAPVDFTEASRAVVEALRRGRFYNAVDAAADPAGFRFWAEDGRIAPTVFHIRAPFSFAHEIRLLRRGATVASGNGPELVFEAREPGVYRAEVYLRARTPLRRDVPWILSNPIVIRKDVP